MKDWLAKNKKIVGVVVAFVAFTIAIFYLIFVPEEVSSTAGIAQVILLYGHSVCWVFLGTASVLWALGRPKRLIEQFAYLGLISYGIFMLTLFFVNV